jgi:hypothetical protein
VPLPEPERRLLLQSLLFRELEPSSVRSAAESIRDWRGLGDAAARVGVEALVWNALMAAYAGDCVPEVEAARLGDGAASIAATASMHLGLAREVQEALRADGIASLPLKGVALAALEPDYGPLRAVSDLDLLVRPEALRAADRRLHALGFEGGSTGVSLEGQVDLSPGGHRPLPHLPVYRRGGLLVELHDRLPTAPGAPPEALDGLWARARVAPVPAGALTVPAREDLLGMLARHVLEHHALDRRMLPRHLADVHALSGADAARAAALYDAPRRTPVARSLALLGEVRTLARRATRDGSSPCERALEADAAAREMAREALRAASIVEALRTSGWRALFPSAAYMRAMAPARGWSRWLPLAHAQRLGAAAIRVVSGRLRSGRGRA